MKLTLEDKTVVKTYVQIDDYECELGELVAILDHLDNCDLLLDSDDLRDTLVKVGVAKRSEFKTTAIVKGDKFDSFRRRLERVYDKHPVSL